MADKDSNLIVSEPQTASVVMLVVTGKGEDSQWFEYRPSYFSDIIRLEWELDRMTADIDPIVAEYLIRNGYARAATPADYPVLNPKTLTPEPSKPAEPAFKPPLQPAAPPVQPAATPLAAPVPPQGSATVIPPPPPGVPWGRKD